MCPLSTHPRRATQGEAHHSTRTRQDAIRKRSPEHYLAKDLKNSQSGFYSERMLTISFA